MNLIDIYQLYLSGELSIADLADIFGTTPSRKARDLLTTRPLTAHLGTSSRKRTRNCPESEENLL